MTIALEIAKMEAGLAAAGVTVKSLCEEAGVNQSTWTRWKSGSNAPLMATWGKVRESFDRITADPCLSAKAS